MSEPAFKRLPIAVLISGGGTTLKNLLAWHSDGRLPVEFKVVISSAVNAGGLQYAEAAGIPTEVISRKSFDEPQSHRDAIFDVCSKRGVELVVMGGYLEHLLIAPEFKNRVVNIHPSLIPAFSGRGYYGMRVHRAVLEYGAKLTGCTVHFVDDEFDHGPIIAQRACPVKNDDTPEALQSRVFELECEIFPEVIASLATREVVVDDRSVTIL